MPGPIQNYVSKATTKAANDLITAVENLPEDKRGWSPLDKGRSALDQEAECAILNAFTVDLLKSKVFPSEFNFEEFTAKKRSLRRIGMRSRNSCFQIPCWQPPQSRLFRIAIWTSK